MHGGGSVPLGVCRLFVLLVCDLFKVSINLHFTVIENGALWCGLWVALFGTLAYLLAHVACVLVHVAYVLVHLV